MKAKKASKRIIGMIAAFAFAVSLCAPTVGIIASAEDVVKVEKFASVDVMEDLADVDLSVYPKNEKGMPQVIRCQEFCYSENDAVSKHYGLYFYIYNPTGKLLKNECSVSMAVAYDAVGDPSSYENVALDICNYSEDKLFYKFKVRDAGKVLNVAKDFAQRNHDARRYDVAGIQLVNVDLTKTVDADVSKTYRFEGFAAGCGEDQAAESTLTCTAGGLETIHLSINHTSYIHDTASDAENFIYDQVHTAYFSIPEEYFEQCGELQKIKAEWYEYKTSPIFVTSDSDAYEALIPYVGDMIWNKSKDLKWRILWEEVANPTQHFFGQTFNKSVDHLFQFDGIHYYDWQDAGYIPRMSFLFLRGEDNWYVSGNDLVKEMKRNRFSSEKMVLGKYPFEYFSDIGVVGAEGDFEDLGISFLNKIDENRIPYLANPKDGCGYVSREIDADDVGVISFKNPDQAIWDAIWNGADYTTSSFAPIQTLTQDDVAKVKSKNFGEKYYVNEEEEDIVYEYCKKETNAGNRAVLFRFAKTDYYASAARFDKLGNGMSSVDGYVARQTVFLNFDVLSLTFRVEDRKDAVFAVVANPVDIVPSIDASDDVFEQGTDIFDGLHFDNPFDEMNKKLKTTLWVLGGTLLAAGIIALIVWICKINGKKE